MDTVVLKKLLNWAKKSPDDDVTEMTFDLPGEEFPVAFEAKTKIEFDQDFVLIWEITTKEGDTSPVLLNIAKINWVKVS